MTSNWPLFCGGDIESNDLEMMLYFSIVVGAFLIPYFLCVIIGAIPMFILEIALGQYTSQGAITAWNICPILKGKSKYLHCKINIILTLA